MISADADKMEKSPQGYLGKVRSNFLGTEFCLYDSGKNPKKAKDKESVRL
jgi:tubby-related protein 1